MPTNVRFHGYIERVPADVISFEQVWKLVTNDDYFDLPDLFDKLNKSKDSPGQWHEAQVHGRPLTEEAKHFISYLQWAVPQINQLWDGFEIQYDISSKSFSDDDVNALLEQVSDPLLRLIIEEMKENWAWREARANGGVFGNGFQFSVLPPTRP
jgi:hypothetical protein